MRDEIILFVDKLTELITAKQPETAVNAIKLYITKYRPQLNEEEKLRLAVVRAWTEMQLGVA